MIKAKGGRLKTERGSSLGVIPAEAGHGVKPQAQSSLFKNFHQTLDQTARLNSLDLPVRVVFQDEARFGRLSDPRRCWAPAPMRPLVPVALVREYTYAYAAVSPADGSLVWMLAAKMDTLNMSSFLEHVSRNYPDECG